MSDPPPESSKKFSSPLRWFVLVLICTMFIGSYYCLETPAALKTQLKEYMNSPDDYETKFQLMYTLYSAPNIILPIFGGYIIDRIGVRNSLLLFMGLVIIAQVIFMIGLSQKSWTGILFGRFLFGVGNESFIIANSTILTHWFCGRELALAFGVNTTFARLGSVVNNVLSIYLIQNTSLLFAFCFGALMVLVCFGIVVLTVVLDKWMESGTVDASFTELSQLESVHGQQVTNALHDGLELVAVDAFEKCESESSSSNSPRRPSELSDDEWNQLKREDLAEQAKQLDDGRAADVDGVNDPVNDFAREVRSLPLLYWVVILCSSCISASIVPFNSISSSLLLERDYFKSLTMSYPNCRLTYSGCQSGSNTPLESVCPSSLWYQPPLPYNVSLVSGGGSGELIYYAQVEQKDIDCASAPWRSSASNQGEGCAEEYCTRIEAAESRASYVMSIPYVLGAVLGPLVGYVVDNVGQRVATALLAALTAFVSHVLVCIRSVHPIVPLVFQGLAVAFISVLWSASCLVVPKQSQGLAFGIYGSVLNLFWAATPLAVAAVYNLSGKLYIPNVEILFMCLSLTGLMLGVYMQYLDRQSGGVLNSVISVEVEKL